MADADFPWTQDSWGSETEEHARGRRIAHRNGRLAWFVVIVLAVVAFEVTADAALTVAVGCLKFGWDEFRLARWLKRTDPDRRRGKICSRFYLAWGLWRVSVGAIAVAFLIVMVHSMVLGPAPGRPPPSFVGAITLSFGGFLLSSLVSSVAVISALRHRVRVWLGPEVRWAREADLWPPMAAPRHRPTSNRAKAIVLSALITLVVIGFLIVILPISSALPQQKIPETVFVLVFMSFLVGVPVLILVLLEIVGNRMIASSPEDCWASSPRAATWPEASQPS